MDSVTVYIETSVWSHALADDAPIERDQTLDFLDRCRSGAYAPFVSRVVLDEIERASPEVATRLFALVSELRPRVIDVSETAERLAEQFVEAGVVPRGKPEDARHVAVAFVSGLDYLVSWNFRHIVSPRRADRFNAVAVLAGYGKALRIVSPQELAYEE